jgi:hypothetical protein
MKAIPATLLLMVLSVVCLRAETRKLMLRAYLHDPSKANGPEFSVEGGKQPLPLRADMISSAVEVALNDGDLRLQFADGQQAAQAKVPGKWTSAIAIIVPGPGSDAALPYRMLLLDDSATTFPWGTSQAVNLLGSDSEITAGELKLTLEAGKITPVPAVRQRDELNIAQTNFRCKVDGQWVLFAERQLQYVDDTRRVFLIHAIPGSQRPFVTTLLDHKPDDLPEKN